MIGKQKTTDEFISESRKKHGERYDYSLVEYVQANNKVKIVCQKHGVFEQLAYNHLRGRGCRKCANDSGSNLNKHTSEDFIKSAKKIHGDTYDYSLVNYNGWNVGVNIVCRKHGLFNQKPTHHLNNCGCPQCGRESIMIVFGKEGDMDRMYGEGMSCSKIGSSLGIGEHVVWEHLKRIGHSRRRCGRQVTYRINHGYFSKIDTCEKAYWLGWMASDGFVVHTKYNHIIGLLLQDRDGEIIDAFRKAIESEHPIKVRRKKYLELRVTSLQMVEDLEKLGIIPNKSLVLKYPEISEEFRWDFWRGMFDGDGCVGKRSMSLCGTKEIVDAFAEQCIKIGYKSQVYKHNRGTNTWYMRTQGYDARGILWKLYGGGLGLSRKRIKAIDWIEKFSKKDGLRRAA